MRKRRKRIFYSLIISAVCVVALLYFIFFEHRFGDWITVYPTCYEGGYEYRICFECDEVEYHNKTERLPHQYGEYHNDIQYQIKFAVCKNCGFKDKSAEYVPPDIPRLYFVGTTGSEVVNIDFTFSYGDTNINSYGDVMIDAASENVFMKKDYDLRLFSDAGLTQPFDVTLNDYIGQQSEYTVKAEYMDKSGVRNITVSELWYRAASLRKKLDNNLANLRYHGADAGISALLYTNGNFKGLHTLDIPNNEKLFALEDNGTHALIYTNDSFGLYDARYESAQNILTPCTVVWPEDNSGKAAAKNSFLEMTEFVKNSSDDEFYKNVSDYIDIDAAIDYLIFIYAFGADSNSADYCNWVTYDGKKWIPSMYNLTYTFGLTIDGKTLAPHETAVPVINEKLSDSSTGVYLWDKLVRNFSDDITKRYNDLRASVLAVENINAVLNKYYSMIPTEVHDAEATEYQEKGKLDTYGGIQPISEWYSEKCSLLDSVFQK